MKNVKAKTKNKIIKNIPDKKIKCTSPARPCKRMRLEASMTVEAALALPIVLFAFFTLIQFFKVMDADRRMQAACETVCMDVSERTTEAAASSIALGEYAKLKAGKAVQDLPVTGIDYIGTQMLLGDDMVTIRLNYKYKLPVSLFGLGQLTQTVVASRRAWVGEDGISGDGDGGEGEGDGEWVYIGKNPTRYHLSANCTYLSNYNMKTSTAGKARELGYKACDRCGRNLSSGTTVYIFPGGDKYHSDSECNAIIAYVKKVRRSEVEYLGACSRCGK